MNLVEKREPKMRRIKYSHNNYLFFVCSGALRWIFNMFLCIVKNNDFDEPVRC